MKMQGCVFTKDINKAMLISDAMETGTVQINSAPARGPDHFPFQVNQNYHKRHKHEHQTQKISNKMIKLTGFQGQWNWITGCHQQH